MDEARVLLFITCLYNLLFTTLNHFRLLFWAPFTSRILTFAPASCWKLYANHSPRACTGKLWTPGLWHNTFLHPAPKTNFLLPHCISSTKHRPSQLLTPSFLFQYYCSTFVYIFFKIPPLDGLVCICFSDCVSDCYSTHKPAVTLTSLPCFSAPSGVSVSSHYSISHQKQVPFEMIHGYLFIYNLW